MTKLAGALDTTDFLLAEYCPLNASGGLSRFIERRLMYGSCTNVSL